MVKPITIKNTENGDTFILEFNRDSVRFAESRGFRIEDVDDFPMTKIYELFFYAFRAHHPSIARANTDEIIDNWGGIRCMPTGLLPRLGELYSVPFGVLNDEETEEEAAEREKNADVTVIL